MANFLVLLLCLLAGAALRRSARVPEAAPQVINGVILHVSLPALTLVHLHRVTLDAAQIGPVLMPWALFAIGAAVFWCIGRWRRWPAATIGALMLVGGFGNTSFVGLPMIESLNGRDGLALGLLIDQLGSYLALSTVGMLAASVCAGAGRLTLPAMARRVAGFPPFIALMASLALRPLEFPAELTQALQRIGDTVAPLALLSVGLQLRGGALRQHAQPLAVGLGYKLLVCPALVLAVIWGLDLEPAMISRVSVIEAAMPPMIGAAVVAAQANLAPRLVSMMVGVGIPLGVSIAPAWLWLLGALTR